MKDKMKADFKKVEKQLNKLKNAIEALKEEPQEPKLEVGKSYRSLQLDIVIINRKGEVGNYGFIDGEYQQDFMCDPLLDWQEIPESEAIELLEKECVKWGGENWENAKIKECLILPTKGDNQGAYKANIRTNRIWNRNGCIFKDGVWAEKLEEPEIKEGRMIWVYQKNANRWLFLPFKEYSNNVKCDVVTSNRQNGDKYHWSTYSLLNPYPDSIEARAIELLRYLYEISGNGDISNEISEFLEEIDNLQQ